MASAPGFHPQLPRCSQIVILVPIVRRYLSCIKLYYGPQTRTSRSAFPELPISPRTLGFVAVGRYGDVAVCTRTVGELSLSGTTFTCHGYLLVLLSDYLFVHNGG